MKRIIYIAFLSLLISCVDEINLTTGGMEPKLVVDAWISNDPDLSYVKVYYSAPFQSGNFHLDFDHPEIDRIYVEAANQNRTYDYMISFTYPQTPKYIPGENVDFQTGENYRLNILLQDGNHYRSGWQQVAPLGDVKNFEYDIVQKIVFRERVNDTPFQYMQYFLDIQAVIENDSPEDFGYYLIASGIEELMTSSQSDFCQCVCYLDIPNIHEGINVFSTSGISGKTIKQNIGSITMARIFRYYIDLDLYTTSAEASVYLAYISEQQKNTGSIFDPIPFNIKGNIINLNNESEEVLGYFFTAHHTRKDELVNRAQFYSQYRHLDFYLDEIPVADSDCREYYPDAINHPPLPFR